MRTPSAGDSERLPSAPVREDAACIIACKHRMQACKNGERGGGWGAVSGRRDGRRTAHGQSGGAAGSTHTASAATGGVRVGRCVCGRRDGRQVVGGRLADRWRSFGGRLAAPAGAGRAGPCAPQAPAAPSVGRGRPMHQCVCEKTRPASPAGMGSGEAIGGRCAGGVRWQWVGGGWRASRACGPAHLGAGGHRQPLPNDVGDACEHTRLAAAVGIGWARPLAVGSKERARTGTSPFLSDSPTACQPLQPRAKAQGAGALQYTPIFATTCKYNPYST